MQQGGITHHTYGPPPGGYPPGGGVPPGGGYPPGGGGPPGGGYPPGGGGYPPGGGAPPGGGYPPGGGAPPGGGYPPGGGGYPPGGGAMPAQAGYGGQAAQPPAPKKGKAGLIIGLILGFVVLCGIGVGVFMAWSGGGKTESDAHKHVPPNCDAVVRVDIHGLLQVEAVKKHVIPALDEKAANDDKKSEVTAFLIDARIDPKEDLKEATMCFTNVSAGGKPDIAIVLGGTFVPDRFVDVLKRHSKKHEFKEATIDGIKVLEAVDSEIKYVGQASDGAIIFASTKELFQESAKTRNAYETVYKLPTEQHVAGTIVKRSVAKLAASSGTNPFVKDLTGAGRLLVTLHLAPGKIEGRMGLADAGKATDLAKLLNAMLSESGRGLSAMGGGVNGADKVVEGLKITAEAKDIVVTAPLPPELIEEGAKSFAKGLDEAGDEL